MRVAAVLGEDVDRAVDDDAVQPRGEGTLEVEVADAPQHPLQGAWTTSSALSRRPVIA